jgi:hypothetical protein
MATVEQKKRWEALINSAEYQNASLITQSGYRIAFGLREQLGLNDNKQDNEEGTREDEA